MYQSFPLHLEDIRVAQSADRSRLWFHYGKISNQGGVYFRFSMANVEDGCPAAVSGKIATWLMQFHSDVSSYASAINDNKLLYIHLIKTTVYAKSL